MTQLVPLEPRFDFTTWFFAGGNPAQPPARPARACGGYECPWPTIARKNNRQIVGFDRE
jgi:hypothetical protein